MKAQRPIGIFDSGIGGLTIARAISRQLPEEQIIYFGDTAHLPYGDKSPELVRSYSQEITKHLIGLGCKQVIIACNTASSVAHNHLVEQFGGQVTILNVIDPIVKGLLAEEAPGKVGIIGTQGTINSGIYASKLQEQAPELHTVSLATPLLAPMIEAEFFNDRINQTVIDAYLSDPLLKDINSLILACTHYPLIKQAIDAYYKGAVNVIDSTDFVGLECKRILEEQGALSTKRDGENKFFVSDLTGSFEETTKLFFGKQVHLAYAPLWESKEI